jgi:hypothetical protein
MAADTCMNVDSVRQVITIVDDEPPTFINPPSNLKLECKSDIPPPIDLLAVDNCHRDQVITPEEKIISGKCENDLIIIRTWEAKDTCGNMATFTQTIEVRDKTIPVIICPNDETVSCNNIPSVNDAGYFATATDNCDDNVELTYNGEKREDFCEDGYYLLRRSWTAIDNCGNESSCEQIIKVITDIETDCWILRLVSVMYDQNINRTEYVWKLFGKNGECKKGLSNIKFEIPHAEIAIEPVDGSRFDNAENSNKYLVENPASNKSKKTNLYGVKYETVGEGIHEGGPETFIYTLPGEMILPEINVEIKAGNVTQNATADIECVCYYNNLKSENITSDAISQNEINLKVYPNPFNNLLNFEFIPDFSTHCKIEIVDINGQKVETIFDDPVQKGIYYHVKFEPESLSSTMFLYRFITNESIQTGKVFYKE